MDEIHLLTVSVCRGNADEQWKLGLLVHQAKGPQNRSRQHLCRVAEQDSGLTSLTAAGSVDFVQNGRTWATAARRSSHGEGCKQNSCLVRLLSQHFHTKSFKLCNHWLPKTYPWNSGEEAIADLKVWHILSGTRSLRDTLKCTRSISEHTLRTHSNKSALKCLQFSLENLLGIGSLYFLILEIASQYFVQSGFELLYSNKPLVSASSLNSWEQKMHPDTGRALFSRLYRFLPLLQILREQECMKTPLLQWVVQCQMQARGKNGPKRREVLLSLQVSSSSETEQFYYY